MFNATSRLGIYCGTKTPEEQNAPTDTLFIYFYSDGIIEGTGFNISFVEDYGKLVYFSFHLINLKSITCSISSNNLKI